MKKLLTVLLATLLTISLLVGCGSTNTATESKTPTTTANVDSSAYTAEKPLVLRIGFENSPTDTSVSRAYVWSKMLEEASDGRIKLEVFASSELGNASEMYQAVQEGSLDMCSLIATTIGNFDPRVELAALPGLFRSIEQAEEFERNGFVGKALDEWYEENGTIRLVRGESNFYYFMTTEKAGQILSIEEMKNKKLRISNSPVLKYFFENSGAVPTPVAWGEIYTSLQRNVIDGTISNIVWGTTAKFPEVAKVISKLPINYNTSDWLMSTKTWAKIPEDLKQIILSTVPKIQEDMVTNWALTEKQNVADLTAKGVVFLEPTEEQSSAYQKACFKIWKDYAIKVWGEEMVTRIENEIINE